MISRNFLLSALAASLTACGGGGSSNSDSGIEVAFRSTLTPATSVTIQSESKQFSNAEGVQIQLNQAFLDIWSISLESDCSDSQFVHSPSWLDWFIAPALAHSDPEPNKLSTPNIINLINADDTELALGQIQPAPAIYCGVTIELLKADDDASNLPESVNMVGRTTYLQGTWQDGSDTEASEFLIDTSSALLPVKALLSEPLQLDSNHLSASIVLNIDYQHWFDGIDFNQIEFSATQEQLLRNISQSITATVL